MSPRNARSLGSAIVGGVTALVFFRLGLLFWVGIVGWVAFAEAEGDSSPLMRVICSGVFGAVVGWGGIVTSLLIPVPADGWLWVPRLAVAVAISLYVLEWGTQFDALSRRTAAYLGYAGVFGATALALASLTGISQFIDPHLSNPLIGTVIAFTGGALAGSAWKSMTITLSKG